MKYTKPKQERSRRTELKFLEAFATLILKNGFSGTTLDDIAILSGQTRAAFVKRFGSKEQAVLVLYAKYCDEVLQALESFQASLDRVEDIEDILLKMSKQFEDLVINHFAANRAMYEIFQTGLTVHPLTKSIFLRTVDLMEKIQSHYLDGAETNPQGSWSAAQLLVTINFNFVMKSMPALPPEASQRHNLVAKILRVALIE